MQQLLIQFARYYGTPNELEIWANMAAKDSQRELKVLSRNNPQSIKPTQGGKALWTPKRKGSLYNSAIKAQLMHFGSTSILVQSHFSSSSQKIKYQEKQPGHTSDHYYHHHWITLIYKTIFLRCIWIKHWSIAFMTECNTFCNEIWGICLKSFWVRD